MNLKRLSVSGFRGVGSHVDLTLGPRTIIYGPNGSGKSSALQAIAWTVYGKLPFLSGTVFTREDALVNDFLSEGKAETTLTFSDGSSITRTRDKQGSSGRGANPVSATFDTEDPQLAIENLIDLSLEEFFAAVFLHQETIRDFITTTPEKRSATVDRMLGTYLLRTLIKVVDPGLPDKAIRAAENNIELVDQQLSQAGVISREMIQQRKLEYGDPTELPQVLESARLDLTSIAAQLGLPDPEATMNDLEGALEAARQHQLDTVAALKNQVGQISALKERYIQASDISWRGVHQRRKEYGDPADLVNLLEEIREDLAPITEKLGLSTPAATTTELEAALTAARRSQPRVMGKLNDAIGELQTLKERYEQAAVTNWQIVRQRREQYGDPANLPSLLNETQRDLLSIAEKLNLQPPQPTLIDLEKTLANARRVQPAMIGNLRQTGGQLSTLGERYQQISKEVVEEVSIPSELANRQSQIEDQVDTANRELSALNRQFAQRRDIEEELEGLRGQVKALPDLRSDSEQIQQTLDTLEAAGKQGKLYNQILSIGLDYLTQAQPERCPLCKQRIANLQTLLATLHEDLPTDVEKMRKDYIAQHEVLVGKQSRIAQLEQSQVRIAELESNLAEFRNLESEFQERQDELERLNDELITIRAEIAEIEGRIKLADEHRRRLDDVLEEIESVLEQPLGEDVSGTLAQAIEATQDSAIEVEGLSFEPIAAKLDRGRELDQIKADETKLQQRLDAVLEEVRQTLRPLPVEDVTTALDKEIQGTRERVSAIGSLDFEPIAGKIARAKELGRMEQDEAELRRQLDAVLAEVKEVLGKPPGKHVIDALDQAIADSREREIAVRAINFQPIAGQLSKARHLTEILEDETRLQELESDYRTARQERARLRHRIQRLTELRSALLDISQTTKRHQQAIVTGILGELDIDRYYQQLDAHPAYRQLQIEPELTKKGTYSYWIKALTDDRSHGTYVQTRFSTAQANCAAIAIFLAVNQHLSKRLETLILDDPSQSMDPEHQMRLAQTLASVPRQVIVATEDPQMFGYLVDAFESPTVHQLDAWTIDGTSLVG